MEGAGHIWYRKRTSVSQETDICVLSYKKRR